MDVCGPITPVSKGGSHFIFKIINSYSRYHFTTSISNKSNCFEAFRSFKAFVEKQTNFRIKKVVSDNGGEFFEGSFRQYLLKEGIESLLTAPHTPQQNPFVERANQTLMERVRCLLLDSKLSFDWWGEAVSTETYLLNRTPVSSLSFKTPFETIFNYAPKMNHLHPFGCPVYIHVNKASLKSKLHPRAEKGFFLGYSEGHKSFRVFNSVTNKIQITHDCLFNEESQEASTHSEEDSLCPGSTSFAPISNAFSQPSNTDHSSPLIETDPPLDIDNSMPSSSFQTAAEFDHESFDDLQESFSPEDCSTHPSQNPLLTKGLLKGWVLDDVPDKAPKDISSKLDTSNILPEG
ncbi:hypothetical protein O181_064464 [Austropuccinia psidii MF-1]|uniref:Integrase catalytic domain-containing protein n=1 Tax=Austropuccinia psidii MF-1 TaxID=1389203 RepID=A0A9Q3EPH2_9BASI|nr:hypothetical protein [Austropuccinia psidii MF-1]